MKSYFSLQWVLLIRKLNDLGFNPLISFVLAAAFFIGISELLFYKTLLAPFILIGIALIISIQSNYQAKTEFVRITFADTAAKTIRLVESLLIALPFSISLLIHGAFWQTALLNFLLFVLTYFTFSFTKQSVIPTPFSKKPFEFTIGFRKTVLLLLAAYGLTIVALLVNNFQLGIFSYLVLFMICISFYGQPEEPFFVWIHAKNPKEFLFEKLKIATIYSSLLISIPVLTLLVFYPFDAWIILLFVLIGFVFLWTSILAKYASFPEEINITYSFLIIICAPVPVLLLFLMPFFYKKALHSLKELLP